MKERNKGVEVEVEASYNKEMDCYYSTSELFPCKKHPSSSSSGGGICAYCLKERLVKLVCSDCGEQRLSSCSCSDEITSSNRNSNSCSVEVGSVGRVSFLIENEKNEKNDKNESSIFQHLSSNKSKLEEKEEVLVLRRSNSNCVEIKRNNGFWRIGKLFKKKNKEVKECGKSVGGFDDEKSNEMWMGVSRSRSLCSFRGGGGGGGGVFGSEDGGESVILSGARSSISAARSSGVNILESGRRSGYSETEHRRSGFDGGERRDFLFENENVGGRKSDYDGVNRRVFSLRESDFKGMDESRFIDLKLDYSSSSSELKNQQQQQQQDLCSFRSGNFLGHDGNCDGGSCRISLNDRGVKRGRKNMKGWKWIFRYHSNWGGNGKKREENNVMFKT